VFFGSTKAIAQSGGYEGYALDRHVNIEVVSKDIAAETEEPDVAFAQ